MEDYIKGSMEALDRDLEMQLIFNRDAEEPVSILFYCLWFTRSREITSHKESSHEAWVQLGSYILHSNPGECVISLFFFLNENLPMDILQKVGREPNFVK